MSILDYPGQGWLQISELGMAFLFSALIGLEREIRQKSAGLRTYTLVGLAAALLMLISKYGFMSILVNDRVVLDPSRIAAQIVSGIGFIGGGLIFVRRESVRGLTTAASVWLTAAVGMACGAGLPVLASVVVAANFVVVFGFPYIASHLPKSRWTPSLIHISYQDGKEVLRDVLVACTRADFSVSRLHVERAKASKGQVAAGEPAEQDVLLHDIAAEDAPRVSDGASESSDRIATIVLELQGTGSITKLAGKLANIGGVVSVNAGDVNVVSD
ncbi:MAG: MgtC/SapB family protein [Burkholderiaceae bacterium]|jgi:putative Mg2+ transporter-C (MgtC) family protein